MISNRDQLISALANNTSRLIFDKATMTTGTSNSFHSLWRATGQPAQGAQPTTAAACNNSTVGAFQFTQQVSPATSYLGYLNAVCANANMTLEIHDRLAHMGGLSGTIGVTAQTVNLDIEALLGSENMDARIGDANYSDIQWWLEWYSTTGTSTVIATVNVTYNDGSTGNLNTVSLPASRGTGHAIPLNSLNPNSAIKYIKKVNTVALSASTGIAGNFGVTATRVRATMPQIIANVGSTYDWAQIGLPEIYNNSCLFLLALITTTSTGIVRGGGKIIHG